MQLAMHQCNISLPDEELLQTFEEKPVIVEDDIFTTKPTSNRTVLAGCFEAMAKKVKSSLDYDAGHNLRYARRMRIDNCADSLSGRELREEFQVKLPLSESCWNDMSDEAIELCLIRTITNQVDDTQHVWHQIRILFDDFMDEITKDFLDRLDRGESLLEPIDVPISEQSSRNYSQVVAKQSPSETPTSNKKSFNVPSNHKASRTKPKSSKMTPQIITIDDDEDGDIILLD